MANKSLNLFIYTVIAFFTLLNFASAAGPQNNGWASVDTRILLLLHPSMGNFDYSNGRFFRTESQIKKSEEIIHELQKAQTQSKEQISKLSSQRDQLLKTRIGLIERREETINDLSAKGAGSAYKLRGKQGKASEFEERYVRRLAELDTQISEIDLQIFKANEIASSSVYLTTDESNKKLDVIKNEILDLISQAAQESGIGVVMDTTYAMTSQKRMTENGSICTLDDAVDVVSSSLFHSFANLKIDSSAKSTVNGPNGRPIPKSHLMVGKSVEMAANLKKYLDFRHYQPEKVSTFSPGKIFLIGGLDLTPWVARKIFDKYKIPEPLKNSFMMLIRNYSDFEKADFGATLK